MAAYTAAQKTKAVDLYLKHGTAEAARQTGISGRTITRWAKTSGVVSQDREKTETARQELARRNAERRERIRSLILEKAEDILHRMDEPHADFKVVDKGIEKVVWDSARSGDVKNYALSLAILIDKYRLEMGEATGRTETIDLAAAESRIDQEIERLSAEISHT